ncbi:hypothetical protein E4U55_000350, partial [Claviceps digitariae]
MFYQGTLQEGISTAVGQQKLVFCFVTKNPPFKLKTGQALTARGHKDENDESQTWENEFLQDDS